MKSQSQALFILAEALIDVSTHLAACESSKFAAAEIEREVNDFVETLESEDELAGVRTSMKRMIDNLKAQARGKSAAGKSAAHAKLEVLSEGAVSIKDELTRELSLSQTHMEEQSLNMNHMNMPTDAWVSSYV